MFCGSFVQHTILSYAPVWTPTALLSIVFAACVILVDPDALSFSRFYKGDMSLAKLGLNLFVVLIFASILSLGWIIESNVNLDQSPVSCHSTFVQDKHISRGKYTSYTLTVAAWDAQEEVYKLDVGAATYHRFEVGEAIQLGVKEGFLGIPWMTDVVPEP
jgi:hypothetical protein